MAGVERRHAEDRDGGRTEPQLAPVVPGLGRQALDLGEARRGVERLRPGRGEFRAEDRVVRLVHELEGLDAIARTRAPWSSRRAAPRRRRTRHRRGRPRSGSRRRFGGVESASSIAASAGSPSTATSASALGSPPPDHGQPDGDGEADGDRGERAAPAGGDGRPPGGEHQETRREPDPERLAGRRIGLSSPTKRASPTPNSRQTAPNSKPWPIDSQTEPSARVMANSAEHGQDYSRGRPAAPRPDGQGMRSTCVSPLVAIGTASGTSVFGCIASA